MFRRLFLRAQCVAFLFLAISAKADVKVDFGGIGFQTETPGVPLPTNVLLQLVYIGSGPGAAFDPIDLTNLNADGWTSGDDRVLSAIILNPTEPAGGWISTAAFDSEFGTGTPGIIDRSFTFNLPAEFANDPNGIKVGIRWFPTITATNAYNATPLTAGTPYGQFTRQGTTLHGGDVWRLVDGEAPDFDPLITVANGGLDPNSAGVASFVVIPEPTAGALLILGGAAAFGAFGRRRS